MKVCPSQNIPSSRHRVHKTFTSIAVNTLPGVITKNCGTIERHSFKLEDINYLDYKLCVGDEYRELLSQYLSSGKKEKVLHLCHFYKQEEVLFDFWDVVDLLNVPTENTISLEVFNIDYFGKTVHEENVERLNEIDYDNFIQVDYHHILSDSVAHHYSVSTKDFDPYYTHERQYTGKIQPVGVIYNPKADRSVNRH